MEEVVFINNIEQVNIGTKDKPYYIPKPTEEMINTFSQWFKNKAKHLNKT